MKKVFLAVLAIMFMATVSYSSPFLVCDPQAGVIKYRVDGNVVVNAETDGSVKYDIGSMEAGTHNLTIEAGNEYVLDGVPQGVIQWSNPIPFELIVPSAPNNPGGLGLIP